MTHFLSFIGMYVSVWVYAKCVWVSTEARRGWQCLWSYRQSRATWTEFWVLNSGPQPRAYPSMHVSMLPGDTLVYESDPGGWGGTVMWCDTFKSSSGPLSALPSGNLSMGKESGMEELILLDEIHLQLPLCCIPWKFSSPEVDVLLW